MGRESVVPGGLPRRAFLRSSLGLTGSMFFGCANDGTPLEPEIASCGDLDAAFAGGERLTVVPFANEDAVVFESPFNQGLDGRLYTDLSKLAPEALVLPNDRFYIRTRYPDLLVPPDPWTIRVSLPGRAPESVPLTELLPMDQPLGTHLMECSGNSRGPGFGMLSACTWSGISLGDVMGRVGISADARVLVSGFDEHSVPSEGEHSTLGASWIFAPRELTDGGAFLATRMNDEPLPPDHGAPVRLVVPGWYGCTCIKWVDAIAVVPDDEPATAHMIEFAARTEQSGVPPLARDFAPASIDAAAMPVRIEKWRIGGRIAYRVVGIVWGGSAPVSALSVAFAGSRFERVALCPPPSTHRTWSLWTHLWTPRAPGAYSIRCRVDDPGARTRRLDRAYYAREVVLDEV